MEYKTTTWWWWTKAFHKELSECIDEHKKTNKKDGSQHHIGGFHQAPNRTSFKAYQESSKTKKNMFLLLGPMYLNELIAIVDVHLKRNS